MKVIKDGKTIATRADKNALRLSDLSPGDVFRYKNGKDTNVYIVGNGECFSLTNFNKYHTGVFYDEYEDEAYGGWDVGGRNTTPLVILYPNAEMNLGDVELTTKEEQKKLDTE